MFVGFWWTWRGSNPQLCSHARPHPDFHYAHAAVRQPAQRDPVQPRSSIQAGAESVAAALFYADARNVEVLTDLQPLNAGRELSVPAGPREVDLSTEVAEYLRTFTNGKVGLLFQTRNATSYLHNNLEQRWLTPRLKAMKIDEKGMGFHAFRRFRKTWLRGEQCQEDINNFWMGHQPETMSELYSRMEFELDRRLEEVDRVGVGFDIPTVNCSKCSKNLEAQSVEVAA
jgi:hypothetical protein